MNYLMNSTTVTNVTQRGSVGSGTFHALSAKRSPILLPEGSWEHALFGGLSFKYKPLQGDFLVGHWPGTTRPLNEVIAGFYDFASQWYPLDLLVWVPHTSPWILYGWSKEPLQSVSVSVTLSPASIEEPQKTIWFGWTASADAATTGIQTGIDQPAHPRQRILDALDELMARGSAANWDGYGAPPVEPLAKAGAKHFIDLLGAKLPEPEVALAPGAITFDWYINPRWIFSVSVSDDRKVHYAGLFGTDKMSGTVELTGALPEIMELGIRRAASGVVAESH